MREQTTTRFRARWAETDQDRARAQALRHLAFRGVPGLDRDQFDAAAQHILIETADRTPAATFRITAFGAGDPLTGSYSAQFYELTSFAGQPGRKAEVGRLCLHPALRGTDLVRRSFASLAQFVLGQGIDHLFGCSSLPGADPVRHGPALAWLAQSALGPAPLCPASRHKDAIPLGTAVPDLSGVPDLVRLYVGLGAWVSGNAIVDRDLNTLHVFTALDIGRMPPAQARAFHSLAATLPPVDAATKAV
jgi:putative hemolysin